MSRRAVLRALAATAAIVAAPGRAQRPAPRRIAWASNDRAAGNYGYEAFKEGLRDHGYVEGRDVTLATTWFDGTLETQERMVVELVGGEPGLIVTQGPIVRLLRKVEVPLPIVVIR
jgi:glutathione S-transferase